MTVLSCITRLAKAGKISDQQAKDARDVYNRMQNEDLFRNMDQATREAYAAVKTAEALDASAKAGKLELARRVAVYNTNIDRINAHPDGPIAGFTALYDRDLHNRPGDRINVTSMQREFYEPQIAAKMHALDVAYRPTMGGLKQDRFGIRTMIRELFGVKTGDKVADDAAKSWKDATDWGVKTAKNFGRAFTEDAEWRLPQFWSSERAMKFGQAELTADIGKHIDTGGVKIWNLDENRPATAAERPAIVAQAIKNIQEDLSPRAAAGASKVFKTEQRVFRFQDGEAGANAYLELMDKYGPGQGRYYAAMQSHAQNMARELALYHVMGPKPGAMGDKLLEAAKAGQANIERARAEFERHGTPLPAGATVRTTAQKIGDTLLHWTGAENPILAERLNDYMLGRLSGVGNKRFADVMAGARAFFASTNLGSAVISAVPGDTVNVEMAAKWRGLNGGRIAGDIAREFAKHNPDREAFATRLGIVAHTISRTAISEKQYGDQLLGTGVFQRAADFVIKAQRLHHWDATLATAFPLEFMFTLGDNAGKSFDALDAPFRSFLTDYGFTADEWAKMSSAQFLPFGAAKALVPDSLEGGLRAKLLSAVGDEKQFAYLAGASNRLRAMTASGAKAGTLAGETSRFLYMYKTFPMSMLLTHGIRAAQEGSQGKLGQAAQLAVFMTIAGAISLEAKQVLSGKDPRDMKSPFFWGESFLQGGALGAFSDYLRDTFSTSGTSLGETLLGPIGQPFNALSELGGIVARRVEEGKPGNIGAWLANDVQRFTPGSALWYTRLLFSRAVVDNIRRELDPAYSKSFSRAQRNAERKNGQKFWWAPGESAPERGPDLGAAVR